MYLERYIGITCDSNVTREDIGGEVSFMVDTVNISGLEVAMFGRKFDVNEIRETFGKGAELILDYLKKEIADEL